MLKIIDVEPYDRPECKLIILFGKPTYGRTLNVAYNYSGLVWFMNRANGNV